MVDHDAPSPIAVNVSAPYSWVASLMTQQDELAFHFCLLQKSLSNLGSRTSFLDAVHHVALYCVALIGSPKTLAGR